LNGAIQALGLSPRLIALFSKFAKYLCKVVHYVILSPTF